MEFLLKSRLWQAVSRRSRQKLIDRIQSPVGRAGAGAHGRALSPKSVDGSQPDDGSVIIDLHNLPALLTVQETAAILRTTTNAIYTMAARAKLPGAVHIGRRLLVRRAELLLFLNEGRVPSPTRSW